MVKPSPPAMLLTLAALVALTLGSVAIPATAEAAYCKAAGKTIKKKRVARAEKSLLCLVNDFRGKRSSRPLKRDPRLTKAARKHSRHMESVGILGHTGIGDGDPPTRARKAGFKCSGCIAENVAYHTGKVSPRDLFELWKRSSGHAVTMKAGRYRATGVGISIGPRLGAAVTQMFASKRASTNYSAEDFLSSRECDRARQGKRSALRSVTAARAQLDRARAIEDDELRARQTAAAQRRVARKVSKRKAASRKVDRRCDLSF